MCLDQAERSTVFPEDRSPLQILQFTAVFLGRLLSWLLDNLWLAYRLLVLKNDLLMVHRSGRLRLLLGLNEELADVGARLVQQPPYRVLPGLLLAYHLLSSLVSFLFRTLLLYHHPLLMRLLKLRSHQ